MDVWVDSKADALAAYQVEVAYDRRKVKIVGVEGGETDAYRDAPSYDRKGFDAGRIIIAAFVADDTLAPGGRSRVARIHFAVIGGRMPSVKWKLVAAAAPGGKRFSPVVEITSVKKEALLRRSRPLTSQSSKRPPYRSLFQVSLAQAGAVEVMWSCLSC